VKVVLVLGGGGAKALAHAGAWQALQERNAHITYIVGTSMGAVIGAALAAGTTPAHGRRSSRPVCSPFTSSARRWAR